MQVSATNKLIKGSLRITKVDEAGNPLPGVTFALYDSSQNSIDSGKTDENGALTFSDLTYGEYFYVETATLFGYVLDPAPYPFSITITVAPGGDPYPLLCAYGSIPHRLGTRSMSTLPFLPMPAVNVVLLCKCPHMNTSILFPYKF